LIRYADGISISEIQRQVGVSRPSIYKCIDKALASGVQAGLKDAFHSPREPEILDDAKAWVVSLACTKPNPSLPAYLTDFLIPNGFEPVGVKRWHYVCIIVDLA